MVMREDKISRMTIKKCRECGKEEDFEENPLCDNCATKIYSKLLLLNLIGELKNSNLEPKEKVNEIVNKLNNILSLNEEFWILISQCENEEQEEKIWKERIGWIKK